ncbi:hypothetical protein A4A49_35147 [Nicotiana attenuata]|uniref:Uncharacterized protein n=1 Tax=Nicotiana attenuata TaxID=49451 RepID=A0A1J6JU25_NICAT|nr:hypothetical protein A4A49_35147 [Nicotiana attenuata]
MNFSLLILLITRDMVIIVFRVIIVFLYKWSNIIKPLLTLNNKLEPFYIYTSQQLELGRKLLRLIVWAPI